MNSTRGDLGALRMSSSKPALFLLLIALHLVESDISTVGFNLKNGSLYYLRLSFVGLQAAGLQILVIAREDGCILCIHGHFWSAI